MSQLKIMSWNIEHFDGKGGIDKHNRPARLDRVERVVDLIHQQQPDIFGISEVKGDIVFGKMTETLRDYSFVITEGPQVQEILIGARHGLRTFFTQKAEFKSGNPGLRPGGLMTVKVEDRNYPILFTHFKSSPEPSGFGLRNNMVERVIGLKKALDSAARHLSENEATQSNLIVIGDMNTMGMTIKDSDRDIPASEEIEIMGRRLNRYGMRVLSKDHDATFNNGSGSSYPPSDLDHVFAADHLQFADVGGGSQVHVGGWAETSDVSLQDVWIEKFSDHAPILLTVKTGD